MLVRTYRARDLPKALELVKAELGEGATVVSTRRIRTGLFSTTLELTAALGAPPLGGGRWAGAASAAAGTPNAASGAASRGGVASHQQGGAGQSRQLQRLLSPLKQELRALRSEMKSWVDERQTNTTDLGRYAEQLERLLLPSAQEGEGRTEVERAALALCDKLERRGMRPEYAEELILEVASSGGTVQERGALCFEGEVHERLKQRLRCAEPWDRDGQRHIVALVGPPGVGKSTLLAKVAARAALIEGREVAIIGFDIDRMGASAGLRSAAEAIGVRWATARDGGELARTVRSVIDAELILIDTTGHSARDTWALRWLHQTLKQVDAEPALVLGTDMGHEELERAIGGFMSLEPRWLCLTRVDETERPASLYNIIRRSQLQPTYLSVGRQIPDDLEDATPERLAALVSGVQSN